MFKNFIRKCFNKGIYEVKRFRNSFKFRKSHSKLEALSNIHKGKRCFIVGNGPSLTTADLSKLKNEICFASHRIYHIYPDTDWRPTYYCAQDRELINESASEISDRVRADKKLIGILPGCTYKQIKHACYLRMIPEEFYPELPNFSENIADGIYEGYTVTYMCIQVAVYMGFKEIYLLGVDHNYSVTRTSDGKIERHGELQDHFSTDDSITNIPQLYKSALAYEAAEKYADKHNIKIYNATRGGCLEAFNRIDFDSLF